MKENREDVDTIAVFKKIRDEWNEFVSRSENSDIYFKKVYEILQKLADFDVSMYRDQYLKGRIFHLLKAKKISSIKDYVSLLQRNPIEIQKLKELLTIHTTGFFRDVTPFRYLEKTLLQKISREINNNSIPIRILSAPCSTGQEVYSLAIIAHHLRKTGVIKNPIAIYGIDIDKASVETSREGTYRIDLIGNISLEAMRANFDVCDDNNYLQVKLEIREYCQFFVNDLFKPFQFNDRFDIILCRNLLIYISPDEQYQLLSNLKTRTRKGGYIMLGNTEGVALMREADFEVENMEQRIYKYLGSRKSTDVDVVVQTISPARHAGTWKPTHSPGIKVPDRIHHLPVIPIKEMERSTKEPRVVPLGAEVGSNVVESLVLKSNKEACELGRAVNITSGTKQDKAEFERIILERAEKIMQEKTNEKLLELEKIIQRTKSTLSQIQLPVDEHKETENLENFTSIIERRAREEEVEFKKIMKLSKRNPKSMLVERESVPEMPQLEVLQQQTKDNLADFVTARAKQEYDEFEKVIKKGYQVKDVNDSPPNETGDVKEKRNDGLDELLENIYDRAKKEVAEFEKIMEKSYENMD